MIKKQKNIGEMLVEKSSSAKSAMRLCGIPEEYISGDSSYYEKLLAFLSAAPKMVGHEALCSMDKELSSLFGSDISVLNGVLTFGAREFCDIIWQGFNSVSVGDNPPKELYEISPTIKKERSEAEPIPLPVPDVTLGEISENTLPALLSTKREDTPTSLISSLLPSCAKTVMLSLRSFRFDRNSRKREIESYISSLENGSPISKKACDELVTALIIELCKKASEKGATVFIDAVSADVPELSRLFEYLKLEKSIPKTVIISDNAVRFREFIEKFEYPLSENTPAIVIASNDVESDRTWFPSGFIMKKSL